MEDVFENLITQPPPPTICRVIETIRKEDPSAYDPTVVSIGPFHMDKLELQGMVEVKWRFLHALLHRFPETDLRDPATAISAQVEELRWQYSEGFPDMTDTDFVRMLLLDGCFILELMFKMVEQIMDRVNHVHHFLSRRGMTIEFPGGKWILHHVVRDLLLLENQIPFPVLEMLYNAMVPSPVTDSNCNLRGIMFICFVCSGAPPEVVPTYILEDQSQLFHLLHFNHRCHDWQCNLEIHFFRPQPQPMLLRLQRAAKMVCTSLCEVYFRIFSMAMSCLVCNPPEHFTGRQQLRFFIPRATMLKSAGIKFRRKQFLGSELYPWKKWSTFDLNMTFSPDGVFEIPLILLHSGSNQEFWNLIAFEQSCEGSEDSRIPECYTSYFQLMGCLIKGEADVDVLVEHGIISNSLSNAAMAATLINDVSKGVTTMADPTVNFLWVMNGVNKYCKSNLHRWRARLMLDYFGNPWSSISVAAAVVLLILTAAQTYYTILAYYTPRG